VRLIEPRPEAWSIRMEGYGGPAQPAPTIGQCLNGGPPRLQVKCRRSLPGRGQYSAGACPQAAGHADMEARGGAQMPIVPDAAVFTAGAHDQADGRAADSAVRLGASG
jgi:hypothetical protein